MGKTFGATLLSFALLCQFEYTTSLRILVNEAKPVDGCLQEQTPFGLMKSHLGETFPTTLRINNITSIPTLRGAQCAGRPEGCGMLNFKNPLTEHKCVKEVPKIIHFIWLEHAMPQKYLDNIINVHEKNPDWQVMLWVNEKGLNASPLLQKTDAFSGKFNVMLLQQHEHPWTNWDLYEKEINVGAKSDLMRLEVTYLYGGIYMDTDSKANHGFDEYGRVFRWPFVTRGTEAYGNLCNCVFGAEKLSPFLKFTMDAWRDIHLNYHVPTTAPYGCGVLTGSFMVYNDPQIMMLSSDQMLHPVDPDPVMYQSFDGSWQPSKSPKSFASESIEVGYDGFMKNAVHFASLPVEQ